MTRAEDRASLRARLRARVGRLQLDVELDTAPGTLALIGPNGAGKSSVLGCLLGAHRVEAGRISVGPHVLLDSERGLDVPLESRRLAYVPQDYALFPHMSVRQNVAFALASGAPRTRDAELASAVDAVLRRHGLEELGERRPDTLSGGEQQRVGLARALAHTPRAVLLDEPLSSLDVASRRQTRVFLGDFLRQAVLPAILVTHDAADARLLADRIAVLEAGRITQVGSWDELAQAPATAFVEGFVASAP